MHEYRHEYPIRIPKRMLWAEVRGNERQLDYAETQAIVWFEQRGYPLLNVMKTERPRGEMSAAVDAGAGWGVPIPWDERDDTGPGGHRRHSLDRHSFPHHERRVAPLRHLLPER